MIFVDANLFMYFVGAGHPLRDEARAFFIQARERDLRLVISAEVLQEILHRYLRTGRSRVADAAFDPGERNGVGDMACGTPGC